MLIYKRKKNADGDPLFIKSLPNNTVGEIDHTLINSVYPFNKDGYKWPRAKRPPKGATRHTHKGGVEDRVPQGHHPPVWSFCLTTHLNTESSNDH